MNITDIISSIAAIFIPAVLIYILLRAFFKFKINPSDNDRDYRCNIRVKMLTGDERKITIFTDVKDNSIKNIAVHSKNLEYDKEWLTYKGDKDIFQVRTNQIASIDIMYEENKDL